MKTMITGVRACLTALAMMSLPAGAVTQVTDVYLHNDLAGTPVAATDSSGDLLWKQTYKPYGERIDPKAPADLQPWYSSKPHVQAAGLSYFGARWYDPQLGRFMSVDPVGFREGNIHSFNRYAYANNNPYKYVDPDGRMTAEALAIVSTGAVLAIAAGKLPENQQRAIGAFLLTGIRFYVLGPGALLSSAGDEQGPKPGPTARGAADTYGTPGGPDDDSRKRELSSEDQKSIRSYQKNIAEHESKLAEFRANPTVRPGMEGQSQEVIEQQQATRIQKLENEIQTFRNNMSKITEGK